MIRLPTAEETNKIYQDTVNFFPMSKLKIMDIFDFVIKEMVCSCFVHTITSAENARRWVKDNGCSKVYVYPETLTPKFDKIPSYGSIGNCPSFTYIGFDGAGSAIDMEILETKNNGIRDSYGSILIKDKSGEYRFIQCFIHYACPLGFRRRLEDTVTGINKSILFRIAQFITKAFSNLKDRIVKEG